MNRMFASRILRLHDGAHSNFPAPGRDHFGGLLWPRILLEGHAPSWPRIFPGGPCFVMAPCRGRDEARPSNRKSEI
jgi:hypothetical protein